MPTRRQLILAALATRVAGITVAAGFETNAGALMFIGEAQELGPDDPDQAIAMSIGDEEPKWQGPGKALLPRMTVSFAALAKANLDEPWVMVETLIGDIKRAVETDDPWLGGLLQFPFERGPVQSRKRQPASETVGAVVSYRVQWKEGFGVP